MKTEIMVFGAIAAIIIILSLTVNIQQPSHQQYSSLPNLGKAPELQGIKGWINSEPFTIESLRGKVVLLDFWTYSCINCIRTLPYLKGWHEKYADKGLVIIGVHTPEFEFEKDYSNVRAAVEKYGIKYAVAQDNDYATWRAYRNNYWPRKYLVDSKGIIRYDHIGEGAYEGTEKAIISLLSETGKEVKMNMTGGKEEPDFSQIGTPELYLGYNFARVPLGNPEGFSAGNIVDYKPVQPALPNTIYLSGKWKNEADRIISAGNSTLYLAYKAKDVNIVAGGGSKIRISLDGKPLSRESFGRDMTEESGNAVVKIDSQRLYNIVSTSGYGTHLLEIYAEPGFEIYTFTFG